jgi:hypothetical protein
MEIKASVDKGERANGEGKKKKVLKKDDQVVMTKKRCYFVMKDGAANMLSDNS